MMDTGIDACEQLKKVSFSGNVIPQIWYKVFVKKELKYPKPHLLAINILSDIVYWYRPSEIRDESTGQILGYKKKFSSDMLQRSYNQFAELFGCSCGQAKEAIVFLEKLGVINRIFRDLIINGVACNNVLFINLDVKCLKELTYPTEEKSSAEVCRNLDGGVSEFPQRGIENLKGGVSKFRQTNTETTPEITTETISSPSYSPNAGTNDGWTEEKEERNDGELTRLFNAMGIDRLKRRELIGPMRAVISDLWRTLRVGKNTVSREAVRKALSGLSPENIEGIFDKFDRQEKKGQIAAPAEYVKALILNAGHDAGLLRVARSTKIPGKNDEPSFDVDDFVKLSMQRLHEE